MKHPDIQFVGATADIQRAPEEIMRLQPDIILFEKTGAGFPANLMEVLEVKTWDLRIIGLSLDNNDMSLYHRTRQTVVDVGDLIKYILG